MVNFSYKNVFSTILLTIIFLLVKISFTEIAATPEKAFFQNKQTRENKSDSTGAIELISPGFQKQLSNVTPSFQWHSLPSENVEYRILISDVNGKILVDQWTDADTTYNIDLSDILQDLNAYYWIVYGYENKRTYKSPVWSFWIDQNLVTDLEITETTIINPKDNWRAGDTIQVRVSIHNCGTREASEATISLYSGSLNENYFNPHCARKSILLANEFIHFLQPDQTKSTVITAALPYGYNNLHVYVAPEKTLGELFYQNNIKQVEKIQTEKAKVELSGLVLIYPNYQDPNKGLNKLSALAINDIYENIKTQQDFFRENSLTLQIQTDTKIIERILTDHNFHFQDEQWGYLLRNEEIQSDLRFLNIDASRYDFIYVYYSWWNSPESWSGYSGYTFPPASGFPSFSAQLVFHDKKINSETTIHETLHILDHLFDLSGSVDFPSPHERKQITTFFTDSKYFKWIVETQPTEKWFMLKNDAVKNLKFNKALQQDKSQQADEIYLAQNYPNPFNQSTVISYQIPQKFTANNPAHVKLVIYDLMGNRIKVLVNGMQNAGSYSVRWNGKNQNGGDVSSSIYFYELRVGFFRQINKLLIIR